MKLSTASIVTFLLIISIGHSAEAKNSAWQQTRSQYQCIEVKKFVVDRQDYSTEQLERAGHIPEETLVRLQHKIVNEINKDKLFPKVELSGKASCQGKSMLLEGKVLEYKKGSRVSRALVGFGTGKQKFTVGINLIDSKNRQTLANKTVIDRKSGGWVGGDSAKGERDFAEKVAKFVKNGK